MKKTEVVMIKPFILVKLIEEETETESGLIIAGGGQQRGKTIFDAEVVEVPVDERVLTKGSRIMFTGANSHKIEVDGEEHLVIKEDQLVAITAKVET